MEQRANSAGLGFAKSRVADTLIYAPQDGVIITRDLELGATVSPGMPIFTLADPRTVWVKANVDESQMKGVAIGNKAVITGGDSGIGRAVASPVLEGPGAGVAVVAPAHDREEALLEVHVLPSEPEGLRLTPATRLAQEQRVDLMHRRHGRHLAEQLLARNVGSHRRAVEALKLLADSPIPTSINTVLIAIACP